MFEQKPQSLILKIKGTARHFAKCESDEKIAITLTYV